MNRSIIIFVMMIFLTSCLFAQPWEEKDDMFNPSGVPSLPFSQPRFADLDADGDEDLILGNLNENPFYLENVGSPTDPAFIAGDDIFYEVSALDAEMGVCADLDNDGDLDFIAGGYTGLNFFENTGTIYEPVFVEVNNFFNGLSVGQNPIPDFADIDADDDLDMVVGFSEDGGVKIYENTGDPTNAEYSEGNTIYIGDVGLYAYPVFADLDADNDQDLLVGRDGHGFIYYQNNGTPQSGIWEENSAVFSGLGNSTYWNSPALVDLNGDETLDLIYGNGTGPLFYYENTGTISVPEWQENTTLFGGVLDVGGASSPFFIDFDNDSDLDMVSGSNLGDIFYYKNIGTPFGPAWQEQSDYFASIDHSIYSAITLGDINGNGQADAIVGDLSGNFYFHRNTGLGFVYVDDVLSSVNLGGWSVPRLVDMDGDDDLDIVAGNEDGNLFYFENQGTATNPEWVEINGYFNGIDVGSSCVPYVADLDLDGDKDVIAGNLAGDVTFFENTGESWNEDPSQVSGISADQNAAPALADLDNDGDKDLTLGNYDGYFDYYENLHIVYEIDTPTAQTTSQKISNFPNPFKSSTVILYSIKTNNTVIPKIEIYNIKGQFVRKINMQLAQTGFSATWDGKNENGVKQKKGIYLCKIKTAAKVLHKKIVMW
ncbi:MAG: T9SS type A sorting domain-containing protein [Candidatus Cloacimonetes bacterium]|nr:T9SS type A sorting domain-containing protein [Candidatus Cloacimonadota bacterium]